MFVISFCLLISLNANYTQLHIASRVRKEVLQDETAWEQLVSLLTCQHLQCLSLEIVVDWETKRVSALSATATRWQYR